MTRALALVALSFALLAPAAAAEPPVVGWLMMDKSGVTIFAEWFRKGLRGLGHVEGETVVLEIRGADGDDRRFPVLAREILERKPSVIVTTCGPAQRAIRNVSRTVPVVAICAEWANFQGEVASMTRPGGATTGFMMLSAESADKRLELLKELQPTLARVAVLHNRVDDWTNHWHETERAASALGITLLALPPVEHATDVEGSLSHAVRERADGLIVFPDATTQGAAVRIADFAIRHRLLTAFDSAIFAMSGGLLAYGPDWRDIGLRVLPRYVDRILKGALPAELPIEQPTKFTFIVNLKTAKALGITIPPSIMLRADRVIE